MMIGLLRARPRITVVLAILAISTGLVLGLAREALADYTWSWYSGCCGTGFPRDTDGFVHEYTGTPDSGSYDRVLGKTYWYSAATGPYTAPDVNDWIKYDWAEMRRCNATSSQNTALKNHEHAHSRGWAHNEDPADKNAAYNWLIRGVYCP